MAERQAGHRAHLAERSPGTERHDKEPALWLRVGAPAHLINGSDPWRCPAITSTSIGWAPSIPLDVEAEMVAGGVVEVLADAQVAFRGQDGSVAQG